QAGQLLLSEPFMIDVYFRRAAVLLTEHSKNGSVGFILNKPFDNKFNDIVQNMPVYDGPIFYGGPVANDQLFYIHKLGKKIKNSIKIQEDLFWGGDFENVVSLLEKKDFKPNDIHFFVGYSGWDVGQLEKEMKKKSWIIAQPDNDLILNSNSKNLWGDVLKTMGSEFSMMANFPEDPSLN
ncbi:MAG TPA: YqgE/AlgH family protein, partial [Bacteroidia bacterium]|nr:YqgE/AlgH family protein [Bacteroidia bacterium]